MGFRFRKSVKLAPGLRLNFGKKSMSMTVGGKGGSINVGSRGVYANVGTPIPGLTYRTRLDSPTRESASADRSLKSVRRTQSYSRDEDAYSTELEAIRMAEEKKRRDEVARYQDRLQKIHNDNQRIWQIHQETPDPHTPPVYVEIPFDEAEPEKPEPHIEKGPPTLVNVPKPGFLALFLPWVKRRYHRALETAENDHAEAAAHWREKMRKAEGAYADACIRFEQNHNLWQQRKTRHLHGEAMRARHFPDRLRSDTSIMEAELTRALEATTWPRETVVSYKLSNNGETVLLDVDLPEIEDLPTHHVREKDGILSATKKTETERLLSYARHVHGASLRLAGVALSTLPACAEVVVSAYTQRLDRAFGRIRDYYLLSVRFDRETFQKINFVSLDLVEPMETVTRFPHRRRLRHKGTLDEIEPFTP